MVAAADEPSALPDQDVPDLGDHQEIEPNQGDGIGCTNELEGDAVQKLAEALKNREVEKKDVLKATPKVAAAKPKAKSSQAKAQKPQKQLEAKAKKHITKKKDQNSKTRAQKQDKDKMKKTRKGQDMTAKSQVKKANVKAGGVQMTAKDVYSRAYHQTRSSPKNLQLLFS